MQLFISNFHYKEEKRQTFLFYTSSLYSPSRNQCLLHFVNITGWIVYMDILHKFLLVSFRNNVLLGQN